MALREVAASAASSMRPEPGTRGTPACSASCTAESLSPIASMASGDGPMKVMLFSAHMRENCARSERKP